MPSFPSSEWWLQSMDEEATLTRKMGPAVMVPSSWEEVTGVEVHPAFRVQEPDRRTSPRSVAEPETWQSAPMQSITEIDSMPWGAIPSAPASPPEFREAFTRVSPPLPLQPHPTGFAPAVAPPCALPELSRPKMRARFDSDASTWRKTIPAMRRVLGLGNAPDFQAAAGPSLPPPAIRDAAPPARWSPLLMAAVAVSLVAMVVMTAIGISTKMAEAARAERTRVVSASGFGGQLLSDGKVFVDGAVQCESLPCELELAEGEHWITVKSPGFDTPPSRAVVVGGEQMTRVHFELAQSRGSVAEASAPVPVATAAEAPRETRTAAALADIAPAPEPAAEPRAVPRAKAAFRAPVANDSWGKLNINSIPAAKVVLDGRPLGSTPVLGVRVRPGAHSVVFIGPGGRRASRGTQVRAGATAVVAARL